MAGENELIVCLLKADLHSRRLSRKAEDPRRSTRDASSFLGQATDLSRGVNWGEFHKRIRHHRLQGLMHKILPKSFEAPKELREALRLTYFKNQLRAQGAVRLVSELTDCCTEMGEHLIVLKGLSLTVRTYEDPGVRLSKDLDVLVPERVMSGLRSRLVDRGFEETINPRASSSRFRKPKDFAFARSSERTLPIEVHTHLFEDFRPYVFDLELAFRRSEPLTGAARAMAFEHELLHLAVHFERHALFLSAIRESDDWFELMMLPQGTNFLLWLYDIALMVHAQPIDWEEVSRLASAWAMAGRIQVVLEMVGRLFEVEIPHPFLNHFRSDSRVELELQRAMLVRETQRSGPMMPSLIARLWTTEQLDMASNVWQATVPTGRYLEARYPGRGRLQKLMAHGMDVAPELVDSLWIKVREAAGSRAFRGQNQ